MKNNLMEEHIPEQRHGGKIDTVATAEFNSVAAALEHYEVAKTRLLNVSDWWEISKVPISTFTLTDAAGNAIKRLAQKGDFIKIDIPGLGTAAGDGYDWVCIENITEESSPEIRMISMQVRPVKNPLKQDEEVAHFYTDESTSTFQVKQYGTCVAAEEHGRNEVPNTDTSSTLDNIRNTLVGWTARIGLSYPQWKSLVKGIIDNP